MMTNQARQNIQVPRSIEFYSSISSIYDAGFEAGYLQAVLALSNIQNQINDLLKNVSGPAQAHLQEMLEYPIEVLSLSTRPYNCLKREGVDTIGQLLDYSTDDLASIRSFGSGCIDEVSDKIKKIGLELRKSPKTDE